MKLPATEFGTVNFYTRHYIARDPAKSCKDREKGRDYKDCACWKWIDETRYADAAPRRAGDNGNLTGETPLGDARYSLETKSWTQAEKKARFILRTMDPAAQPSLLAEERREKNTELTVKQACDLWIAKCVTDFGDEAYTQTSRSLMNKIQNWADSQVPPIHFACDITEKNLEAWRTSKDWATHEHGGIYTEGTQAQRWSWMRSVFAYLHRTGALATDPIFKLPFFKAPPQVYQGAYTEAQLKQIFDHAERGALPPGHMTEERSVLRQRNVGFLTGLLHIGCDVVDMVKFDKTKLTQERIGKELRWVYDYDRQKRRKNTGKKASIVGLSAAVAKLLLAIPELSDSVPNCPFRKVGRTNVQTARNWGLRIKALLTAAGVTHVLLEGIDEVTGRQRTKAANAKQFRHTFIKRRIEKGKRLEAIAVNVGHRGTAMIEKVYGTMDARLRKAHIKEEFAHETAARRQKNGGLKIVSASRSDARKPVRRRSQGSAS
jgi:hypothetical protein